MLKVISVQSSIYNIYHVHTHTFPVFQNVTGGKPSWIFVKTEVDYIVHGPNNGIQLRCQWAPVTPDSGLVSLYLLCLQWLYWNFNSAYHLMLLGIPKNGLLARNGFIGQLGVTWVANILEPCHFLVSHLWTKHMSGRRLPKSVTRGN